MATSNRKPYATATVLDQPFLDECAQNLVCQLEATVDIEAPDGSFIRASDRNKYVGDVFYEALLNFPTITRTIGDWLSTQLEFSEVRLELSNADGRFNKFCPGGASYGSWIGGQVTVRIGLRDVSSSYFTIFRGKVSQSAGFARTTAAIQITARDSFDKIAVSFPTIAFTRNDYPKIEEDTLGQFIPVIYGDWTTAYNPLVGASVPGIIVNGRDPLVEPAKSRDVTITVGGAATMLTSVLHCFSDLDQVELETDGSLPTGLSTATRYYIRNSTTDTFQLSTTPSGSLASTSGSQSGNHRVKGFTGTPTYRNIRCVLSSIPLALFDSANVYLKRSESVYRIATSDIVNVSSDNNAFQVLQNTGSTLVEGENFTYKSGDLFFCRVKGKDLGPYSDNAVWQARDLLISYAGLSPTDFSSNWSTYRDKSAPSQSTIATIKSRVWIQEPQTAIEYAISLLQQVRLEVFVTKDFVLKLNSLHFEDFQASPSTTITNWDIERNSLKISIDDRNNFNRSKGAYGYLPDKNEAAFFTRVQRNDGAISAATVAISKQISFPNLYVQGQVEAQIVEILRMAAAYFETIEVTCTWRSLLKEPGDFVLLNVTVGQSTFDNVPCVIRSISYDPTGLRVTLKLWSLQLLPFPGYNPALPGTTGGYLATISVE